MLYFDWLGVQTHYFKLQSLWNSRLKIKFCHSEDDLTQLIQNHPCLLLSILYILFWTSQLKIISGTFSWEEKPQNWHCLWSGLENSPLHGVIFFKLNFSGTWTEHTQTVHLPGPSPQMELPACFFLSHFENGAVFTENSLIQGFDSTCLFVPFEPMYLYLDQRNIY